MTSTGRIISDHRTAGAPPFYGLLEFMVDVVGADSSECSCRPGAWIEELTAFGAPAAVVGFGDAALGTSIAASAAGRLPATTSLHADFLTPVPSGALTCASRVIDVQDGVALTTGSIAAGGSPVATVAIRSMLITPRPAPTAGGGDTPRSRPVTAARQVRGGVLDGGLARACEVLVTDVADRALTLRLVPAIELGRTHGVVHGGGIGAMGTLALVALRERVIPGDLTWRPLDVHVDFLRELPSAGEVEVVGTAVHLGRRLAVFEATVSDAAGRLVAILRETVVMTPKERAS